MILARTIASLAAGLLLHTCSLAADTAAAEITSADAVLDRLATLERRFDELAAENRALRAQVAALEAARTQPAPVAAPVPAPQAGKAAPVSVATSGKAEKLSLGGFAHINAEAGDAPDARWNGIHDRFFLRRARLNASATFANDFSFKLEGDFGNNSIGGRSGYSAQLTDAYATWAATPAASVRVGQFKTPFGYEQLLSDTTTAMIERPFPSDRLTVSRQIGVGVFGDIVPKHLAYSTGIFNGNGVNVGDNDNDEFLYVGRLSGTLAQGGGDENPFKLSAGMNAFTMDTTGTTRQRDGVGLDLQLSWGPAALTGEWLRNDLTASSGSEYSADGWSMLATWSINKRWMIMGRFETYDPSSLALNDETDSWTIGGTYFINGNNTKLTLNYMQGRTGTADNQGRILGRLQIVY